MGTNKTPKDDLGATKNIMGALVRMKPKPHEKMKVGKKAKKKQVKKPASKE